MYLQDYEFLKCHKPNVLLDQTYLPIYPTATKQHREEKKNRTFLQHGGETRKLGQNRGRTEIAHLDCPLGAR